MQTRNRFRTVERYFKREIGLIYHHFLIKGLAKVGRGMIIAPFIATERND